MSPYPSSENPPGKTPAALTPNEERLRALAYAEGWREGCAQRRSIRTVTLPVSPGRYAYLELPPGRFTEDEWEQLNVLLAAFRVGLVAPPESFSEGSVYPMGGDQQ